ncbi:alpha-2-macroglobulin family protein [Pantanalinema rosaneae CENA516]|uniref:alpha-2-macroglobulin family protein n=1 Tax=Pantanalinema rosaneae TaxID=1620701 RepID=UPI003D6EC323
MKFSDRVFKPWIIVIALLVCLGMTGCSTATLSPGAAPLPAVAPLTTPKLPDWIEQISPTGTASPLAQIRVRFKDPLIPLESLESQNQQEILSKFELTPPLKGTFRFLTPRMVGFQADTSTPQATRVRVTLKAGLADLNNHRLDQDFAWTFNTEPLKLTNLPTSFSEPGVPPEPIDLKPVLKLTANAELNPASLREHARLIPEGKEGITLKPSLIEQPQAEEQSPSDRFDPSNQNWIYTLSPDRALETGTRYTLEITPGLSPAAGNLPTEQAISSQLVTYSPLQFQNMTYTGQPDAGGPFGRFSQGVAQLNFNNGIEAESALAHISVSPEPKNQDVPLVRAYDGEAVVTLNPWALEPDKRYTITIGSDLKDKFGQTLGQKVNLTYDTGDAAADIWAPSDLHIFPTQRRDELQLNVSTVNLSSFKSAVRTVQPTDLVYTNSAYPRGEGNDLLPDPVSWQTTRVPNKKNQSVETTLPLQKQLGSDTGMLAYGVQARTNSYKEDNRQQWREPTFYGLVQLTNLGVFAQWFPESGLVRVHQLSDGQPVAKAQVQVYQSRLDTKDRSQPTPCATGTTNAAGMLTLDRAAFQSCVNRSADTAPPLLVVAQVGKDWAFTRSYEYSGAYEYGVDAGWENNKPVSRGTIFSDRQLYQPGETAWFTGAAYYLQNGSLRQDQKAQYTVSLKSPDGKQTDLGTRTTNEFGTFSVELPIAKTQPLGFYTLRAKGQNGVEITGEFRVAEFKPPNFKVALTLDVPKDRDLLPINPDGVTPPLPIVQADQTIQANVKSQYLFGSPVQGGQAKYFVTRQQTEFTPAGRDEFSFGRKWFWPEEAPEVSSDVLQSNQTLDNSGQGQFSIALDKTIPYPMVYRVDAQVADVSNLTVADSQSVIAVPSDRLIGLKSNFVADAGKEFPVQVIVTDPQGQAVSNQRVRLELQEMIYSRATRAVEGSRVNQNQVEYKTVATTDVSSQSEPQTANLTPPKSGSYRIRATLAGRDEASATDVQIWATGGTPTYWGDRYRNNRLELKLDKKTYRPGETATVLLQSPYPEAELYFAIVRHDVIYQTVTKVTGSAPQIQFQVTPEMLPNAAVEAVLVRQGEPLAQIEPGSLEDLVRIGLAPFQTDLGDRYLKVDVAPAIGKEGTPAAEPGTDQTVQLTVKDAQDKPVRGQFTVMVVNEAILQLTGYRPPDLVKTVYAEQPISIRISDNRPDVVLQPMSSPLQKGWGYGGGFSEGAANTRTRTDFKPTAYYNGSVLTDANGQATIRFRLPDDLTTWRVMAVATTANNGNWQFGNGDTTFITSRPLVASPILPQFARPGDRFQVGAAVTNNTGNNGDLTINGTVTEPLKFDNSSGSQQARMDGSGTQAYRFPVMVDRAGQATVKFTTQLNGANDAFEVPLDVKPLEITEQVVEAGTTTKQTTIPINVDKNVDNTTGGLEISLASTLIPQLTAPAAQVLEDNDLPFLEPAASQLAIAASLQTLSQTYGQTFASFNPTQQATQAIAQLQTLQKPDGGFAAYPGAERSDPFVTPYAAQAIALANQGFGSQELLPSLTAYLRKLLADPGQYSFCKQALCKNQVRLETLIALAALGDRRGDFLSDIYAQRNQLDLVQQIKLARYLSQFPDWQAEANTLTNQVQELVYQTGRSAKVNLPNNWSWLSSPTAAQAQAVRLFIAQNQPPEQIDRLVQGLLAQRRDGVWQNNYDNAEALVALVDYSRLQPTPPNFTATAQLAGKTLTKAQFQGYRKPSQDVRVAMSDLPRNRHDLVLKKSGNGLLHYLVAYRYRLQGNQPGRLNGLRVTRTIRPANENKTLYKTGLYATEPLTLAAGQVYDIGLEVITDHPVDHVVITDPLPAGFEAVDNSFQTSTPYYQAKGDSWQLNYQTIHRDRVVAFGDKLDPGVYTLHYLVRSVTPGTFVYPGAEAHLQYAPEEFGRSAATTLTIAAQ